MIEVLEKLKKIFPKYQQKEDDIKILESIIDGLYDENDFLHASIMLFKTTKFKTLTPFRNKETFIKFKNLDQEKYPTWLDNLSFNEQHDLKDNYKIIAGYCLGDWDKYECNHPDILELIYEYHKRSVPYWTITAYIKESFNDNNQEITKQDLLELMNHGEKFIQGCRNIFKRQQDFKSLLKKDGLNYIESVGEKINVGAGR